MDELRDSLLTAAGILTAIDETGAYYDALGAMGLLKHAMRLTRLVSHLPSLIADSAETAKLRARLQLVDYVCRSHHAASLVTWEGACPVCMDAGGSQFYIDNAALYRPSAPHHTGASDE